MCFANDDNTANRIWVEFTSAPLQVLLGGTPGLASCNEGELILFPCYLSYSIVYISAMLLTFAFAARGVGRV